MKRRYLGGIVMWLSLASGLAGQPTPQPALPAAGKAEALLDIDYASGKVTAVHIVKSTGSAKLDATTIRSFMRWRCRPYTYHHIRVPITYTVEEAKPKS